MRRFFYFEGFPKKIKNSLKKFLWTGVIFYKVTENSGEKWAEERRVFPDERNVGLFLVEVKCFYLVLLMNHCEPGNSNYIVLPTYFLQISNNFKDGGFV